MSNPLHGRPPNGSGSSSASSSSSLSGSSPISVTVQPGNGGHNSSSSSSGGGILKDKVGLPPVYLNLNDQAKDQSSSSCSPLQHWDDTRTADVWLSSLHSVIFIITCALAAFILFRNVLTWRRAHGAVGLRHHYLHDDRLLDRGHSVHLHGPDQPARLSAQVQDPAGHQRAGGSAPTAEGDLVRGLQPNIRGHSAGLRQLPANGGPRTERHPRPAHFPLGLLRADGVHPDGGAGLLLLAPPAAPQAHLQVHSQAAPRVDGPHLGDGHLLPPHRAHLQQPSAALPRRLSDGQPCGHRVAVVRPGHPVHAQRPLRLPPAVLSQPRGARLSPPEIQQLFRSAGRAGPPPWHRFPVPRHQVICATHHDVELQAAARCLPRSDDEVSRRSPLVHGSRPLSVCVTNFNCDMAGQILFCTPQT